MPIPFDSKNTFYRSPFGAVEQDTVIHFRLLLPRSVRCNFTEMAVKYDYDYDWNFIPLFWSGYFDSETTLWECEFKPERTGLYWYSFKLHTSEGQRFVVPADIDLKSSIERSPGRSWQITCYKKGFTTPDWPVGGVMYQIFPDRFHFSGTPKNITRTDLYIHDNWNDIPQWWPNDHGEITNSDFFQGDLKGVTQKLDYIESLGITCIYLNPIVEAYSSHRYDVGDYSKIDPMLGTEEDFVELCAEAKRRGIHVITDGVFSHTGSDSIYFNRNKRYGNGGAFNDRNSPYFSWYRFNEWPYNYNSWWGFYTLPEVNETDHSFDEYINGQHGIVRKWMRCGSSGWRLDVADELPDEFLIKLRHAVKKQNPQGIVIGEVWEDASNKESYGERRRFLLGEQLDSVMNYVFRHAILDFISGMDSKYVMESIMSIIENYPRPVLRILMNLLSTHDTERAITMLAGENLNGRDRNWQAHAKLTHDQYNRGIKLMKLASGIQFTLPGFPCVYYGDEAGMEGYRDPFNRRCYPWGSVNEELVGWYRQLGSLRKSCSALWDGDILNVYSQGRLLTYIRRDADSSIYCGFNSGFTDIISDIPPGYSNGTPLFDTRIENGKLIIPSSGCVFITLEK